MFFGIAIINSLLSLNQDTGGGLTILGLLIILIYAVSDDIRWEKLWKKILWVFGMWITYNLLIMVLIFTIGRIISPLIFLGGRASFILIIYPLAGLPLLLYSMKKSKKFMKKIDTKNDL